MVDQQFGELERKDHSTGNPRDRDRDRCLQDGLGSVLQQRFHERLLVSGRENSSHQCTRINRSNIRSASLLQGNFCAVEVGQCYICGVCQQNGRD